MGWKSTAVLSGAGLLATWFVSMPATDRSVTGPTVPAGSATNVSSATVDIQREAARLQVRLHPEPHYAAETARNPFRFGAPAAPVRRQADAGSLPRVEPTIAPLAPPVSQPRLSLEGVATDTAGGGQQRTAIVRTEAGLVLVREGDRLSERLTVLKVAADAVELVNTTDGSMVRLSLR